MANLLEKECSLYLLQHKSNPVNWFAWGNQAFEKAKIEKKPVFASIGYSSCHWCHVMAHESFENNGVAKILNENFVSIKVDREEFPDIDSFYMEFLTQSSGYGGWPLNVFLNSKKNPLFGISYVPIPRFAKLLEEISAKYAEMESVRETELENNFSMGKVSETIGKKFFKAARELQLHGESGPKFPMALALLFELEKIGKISGQISVELENLVLKGLFDQIEGGWFRYSVDGEWKIPHFEKMLYDQATLLLLCSKAFELSKNEMFKIAILKTIKWLEFHMKLENGLYGSATDADTVEGEGFYYTVSKKQNETVSKLFKLDLCGEHDGRLVPWLGLEFFQKNRIECEKLVELLKFERKKLHFPNLDSKAVVSWNCFLGYSLLKCAKALNDEKIVKMAVGLFENISKFFEGKKLCHAIYGMKKFESNEYLQDYSAFLLFSSEIAKIKPETAKLCNELIELIEKKFVIDGNIASTSETVFDNFGLWQDLPFPSGASMLFNALINLNSEKIGKFLENFFGVLEFASNSPEFFGFWLYGFEKYFKGQ